MAKQSSDAAKQIAAVREAVSAGDNTDPAGSYIKRIAQQQALATNVLDQPYSPNWP